MTGWRRSLGALTTALLPLALAACGNKSEADKAAAPLPRALEALGVHGATWAKANLDGDGIVLQDVRADLDGTGQVHAATVTVRAFRETDGGWQAELVKADGIDGAARAGQVTILAPRARRVAGAWAVEDRGRVLESYEGPLDGVPVNLRSAGFGPAPRIPGRPDATQLAASGIRLSDKAPGALAPLSGLDWTVSVRFESGRPGAAFVEVERAEAAGWSMSGRIALAGGTGLVPALATMKPSDMPDPARWPEGVLLQEADLDMTLARPGAFLGTLARDPVAGALAAKVAAGGPASWHVTMRPSRPVPVRDLPAILAGAGADARLGLVAQIRDIVIPSQGAMAQPAGMDRSTSALAVGR